MLLTGETPMARMKERGGAKSQWRVVEDVAVYLQCESSRRDQDCTQVRVRILTKKSEAEARLETNKTHSEDA